MLDPQLLILHVRGQSHRPRSPDSFFFEFAENLDLLHIWSLSKVRSNMLFRFDINYWGASWTIFTLLTLYSMLVMGDFKCGKCVTLLLTWVKGKARYGRTLLILVNVYNKCIAKQYFKLPRIYFWLWSKVTRNYILSHLWNADEIND